MPDQSACRCAVRLGQAELSRCVDAVATPPKRRPPISKRHTSTCRVFLRSDCSSFGCGVGDVAAARVTASCPGAQAAQTFELAGAFSRSSTFGSVSEALVPAPALQNIVNGGSCGVICVAVPGSDGPFAAALVQETASRLLRLATACNTSDGSPFLTLRCYQVRSSHAPLHPHDRHPVGPHSPCRSVQAP